MSNVRQLMDHGVPVYPITDRSLVLGLQDNAFATYVMAWDGASTPVVAQIPAGVVVTYNGTNYTGTLAASSATAQDLYLVASGTQQGEYDRYITTHTGSTYAWNQVGSTAIVSPVIADDLVTNDASKALSAKQGKVLNDKTSELEAKVDENEQSVGIRNNSAWSSSDGSNVAISGRDSSEKFPYYESMIIETDGNIYQYLFWRDDTYLGYSANNINAFPAATKIALNFYSGNPTYIRYSPNGIGQAVTSIKEELDGIESSFVASGPVVLLSKSIPAGTVIKEVKGAEWSVISLYEPRMAGGVAIYPQDLPFTTSKKYDRANASISGSPVLTIVTEGLSDNVEELQDNVNEMQETVFPVLPSFTVPQGCLTTIDWPEFGEISAEESYFVHDAEEFAAAASANAKRDVILRGDVIIPQTRVGGEFHLFGNGHRIAGYSNVFEGTPVIETDTHNGYAKAGTLLTSAMPYPYFIDDSFKVYQWKKSKWYDTTGLIENADGTATNAATGSFRLPIPADFKLSASELNGTYIQLFNWYNTIIGKVDSLADGYLYFTVIDGAGYSINAEYNNNARYTSFRVVNLRSAVSIYIDDDYIYVPKGVEHLYLLGRVLTGLASAKIHIEDTVIFGAIDNSASKPSYKVENCEIAYANNPVFHWGDFESLEINGCKIHDTLDSVIWATSSYIKVDGCDIVNCSSSLRNYANMYLNQPGKYWIRNNTFRDFNYCGVFVGADGTYIPGEGIVENNIFEQSEKYDSEHCVASDSGAIYVASWNKKEIGAVVRYNTIRNINGRGSNRGIFCDDGASYFYLYRNKVSRVANSYSIDARYGTGRSGPSGYILNNGKRVVNNVVDGDIRCVVGALSTEVLSEVLGNIRLYGNRWNNGDVIQSLDNNALFSFTNTAKDKLGYFDADGNPHSSLNL